MARPSGTSPVVASRHSAIRSLRASATIMVLRVTPRASAVRARYLGQQAVRLVHQESPGELQHPTAHAGVAGFGKTALTSLLAALVRSSRQTGVSRHCFAVPQVARENLLYQHIGRLDADPDHPGEQVDRRIAWFSGCPLQSFEASPLNLVNLLFDKAEASHVAP